MFDIFSIIQFMTGQVLHHLSFSNIFTPKNPFVILKFSFFSLQYFNKFFVQLRFVSYSRNMFMFSVVKRKIPLKNLSFWAINISPLKFAKQQLIIILRNRKKVHFISTLTFLSPNYRCQRFHFFTLLPSNFSAEIVLLFLLKYRCWLLTH